MNRNRKEMQGSKWRRGELEKKKSNHREFSGVPIIAKIGKRKKNEGKMMKKQERGCRRRSCQVHCDVGTSVKRRRGGGFFMHFSSSN